LAGFAAPINRLLMGSILRQLEVCLQTRARCVYVLKLFRACQAKS